MKAHVGGAIAYLAWRKGLSFSQLAALVSLPQQYVSGVCNGRRGMRPATVARFAEALGVSLLALDAVSRSREAYIFSDYTTREIAKSFGGSKKERNMMVRFINQHEKRRTAA